VHALARVLVEAGVEDQPMQVHAEGLAGFMTYRSVHRVAERAIKENATTPVRAVRYQPREDAQRDGPARDLCGETGDAVTPAPEERSGAASGARAYA
jgi:hypothetical protein